MRTGRPKEPLDLTGGEQAKLQMLANRPKTDQRTAMRARIVLECARGVDNAEAARRLRINPATVGKWRSRFIKQRMRGLADAPRPGQPRKITDAKVEQVV